MLRELHESVMKFFSCRYKLSFVRCITLLYEYCQAKAYLEASNTTYAENVIINMRYIKLFMTDDIYNPIINKFKRIRDTLNHGYFTQDVFDNCKILFSDDLFKPFLEKMEFPADVIDMFTNTDSLKFNKYNLSSDKLTSVNYFS